MSTQETTLPQQDAGVTKQDEAFVEEMLKGFIQALVTEDSEAKTFSELLQKREP